MDPRVLIVTGAGASSVLGADDKPLAMMSEWAGSLVDELKYAADLIGLRQDMRGDEFEAALGRFVAFSDALSVVAPLHKFGQVEAVITEPERALNKLDSATWLRLAEENVRSVRRAIHKNLYTQFGQQRIDDQAALHAYSKLHRQIRDAFRGSPPVLLAHVTTNFDHAIEAAIGQAGSGGTPNRVLDGFGKAFGGRSEPWAPNLLAYSQSGDDEAPILHLHGAIGWYFTEDGNSIFRRNSDDPFNPELTPALLLPDDKKDVTRFPAPLQEVWKQFRQLCEGSTHIIVLGHSLHDNHLVEMLRTSEKPVAVIVYAANYDAEGFDDETEDYGAEIRDLLPNAEFIPGRFGGNTDAPDIEPHKFGEWLRFNAR